MRFLAILKDSFYETIDFKIFYVLVGICVLLTIACASFTFHREPFEEVLEKNLGQEFKVVEAKQLARDFFTPMAKYRVELEPKVEGREQVHQAVEQGAKRNYRVHDTDLQRRRVELLIQRPEGGGPMGMPLDLKPPPERVLPKEWPALVEQYFLSIAGVRAVKLPDEQATSRIPIELDVNWGELRNSHKIGLLFGAWKIDMREKTLGESVHDWLQMPLIGWIAGWAGIIIAVVVTSFFVPNMIRKGTVDFLIVKPISRPRLLIYKYLGGLTFVFMNAAILVGGTWIAFGFTTGNWSPWYLASVLVLTFYFAILYSFSVLIGVVTRSAIAAILMTIGFWFVLFVISRAFLVMHLPAIEESIKENAAWLLPIVDAIHFIFPKPAALDIMNSSLLLQSNGSEVSLKLQQEAMSKLSWSETIYTSLGFIAVMLGLACWRFSRRDY